MDVFASAQPDASHAVVIKDIGKGALDPFAVPDKRHGWRLHHDGHRARPNDLPREREIGGAPIEGDHELTTPAKVDLWLSETADAIALQRPLPDNALRIVARGERTDA